MGPLLMSSWRQGTRHLRNLIIRLSITQIVLLTVTALPGVQFREGLFTSWIASSAFVLLTAFVRPVLLALTIPLTIMTAGLFIFVIDGILLLVTDLMTGLEIAGFGWAILSSVIMGVMNIWVESGFKRLGWMEREDEDDPSEIVSPGWALRILLGSGLLFGIAFSGLTAFQVTLALSVVTANLAILAGSALLTLLAVSLGVSWLVAEGLEASHRTRFSIVVGILTAIAGIAVLAFVALEPLADPVPPTPASDVRYWELATGSRIAYTHYAASAGTGDTPLVYLHDGPGLAVLGPEREFYRQFANDGFDVYLYDRAGTGHSDRLESIGAYGMEREIADLDAIRSELGVNELILIGQGAGAELAARYLSRYPERVRKAVLHSPTPLWNDDQFFQNYARTGSAIGPSPVLEPRLLLAAALASYGPKAAQNLASQEEMGVFLAHSFNPKTWVCARHSERAPMIDGAEFNYYVQLRTELTTRSLPDPRPRLADNLTPSLILAAECDYIPWDVILQYKEALLNETVFYFEDAGHMINATQPSRMAGVIRAFLIETPFPVAPYPGSENPRPSVSP
jgi:proline iminopeptidase